MLREHGEELPPFAAAQRGEGPGGAVAGGQRAGRAPRPALRRGRVNAAEAVGRTLFDARASATRSGSSAAATSSRRKPCATAARVPSRAPRGRRDLHGRRLRARVSGASASAASTRGPGSRTRLTGPHRGGQEPHAAAARVPREAPAAALRSNFRIDQAGLVDGGRRDRRARPLGPRAPAPTTRPRAAGARVVERRPVVLMLPLDVQARAGADGRADRRARPTPAPPAPRPAGRRGSRRAARRAPSGR